MAKKEPVSVNWQILFAIIPVINLWASFRIEKLRLYLLVNIAMLAVEFLITLVILDEQSFDCFWGISDECEVPIDNSILYLELLISAAVSVVVIKKWSQEWNAKLAENS